MVGIRQCLAILAAVCCLLATATISQATTIQDFENAPAWSVLGGDTRGGTFAVTDAPEGQGHAGQCSWAATHANYLEAQLVKPVVIDDFAEGCNGTITLKAYSENWRAIQGIYLRLIDAQGEVFHLIQGVTISKPGWQDLSFQVTPDAGKYATWGSTVNKHIDLPVRFLGFNINFNTAIPGAGSVYFDEIASQAVKTAAAVTNVGAPAMVEDFERATAWSVLGGAARGGAFNVTDAPEGQGHAGKCSWNATHANYLEVQLNEARVLHAFDDGCNGTITLRVYSDNWSAIQGIYLRLIDAQGEVFHLIKGVTISKPGWQDVNFQVTSDATKYFTWGSNVNKQIDLPVRFLGFNVNFNMAVPGAGSLFFDNITCTGVEVGHRVDAQETLWRFDTHDRWNRSGGSDVAQLQQTDTTTTVTIAPAAKPVEFPLTEKTMGIRTYTMPTGITVKAELQNGTGATLGIRLRDAQGEIFALRQQPLVAGMNTVTWDIARDVAGSWGGKKNGVIDYPVNMSELYCARSAGQDPVTIRFDSATITQRIPAMQAVDVDLDTGNPIHIVEVGAEKPVAIVLRNTANAPLTFTMKVSMEDYLGKTTPYEKTMTIAGQGESQWVLPLPKEQGIWWVNYTLTEQNSDEQAKGTRTFCYMQPAGPTPGYAKGNLFGVMTFTSSWSKSDYQNEILAAALCGVKMMRIGGGWEGIQQKDGTCNWTGLDKLVNDYTAQGIETQYMLSFTPGWAVQHPEAISKGWEYYKSSAPRIDAWRSFISAFAAHYNGRMRYLEIWNEPDIAFWNGSYDEYMQLLQAGYEEIKRVNPQLKVMNGGFCGYRNPKFVLDVAKNGQQWFDIFAYHAHGAFPGFQQEVDGTIAEAMKSFTTPKQLYFNETAISSMGGTERTQAETLFKKLTFGLSRGSIGYTWYDLRNDGFNPSDIMHNYGMVTFDFYPKPVYPVFNTLARYLSDKQYKMSLDLGANRWGMVFANANDQVITTWSDAAGDAEQYLIVKTDAKQAFRMDMMGNQTPVPVVNGSAILSISQNPGYLVLNGAKTLPKLGEPLVAIQGTPIAIPGHTVTLQVSVFNPFEKPCTVSGTWHAPANLSIADPTSSVNVAARSKGTLTAHITVPATENADYGATKAVSFNYALQGTPWAGTIQVPLTMAVSIPAGGDEQRPADFVIDTQKHIFNYYDNDPNKAYLTWKGAQDLSAKVWLGHTADALTLRVAVRDDVQHQPFTDGNIWQGDSIQLALQTPRQSGYWEVGLAQLANGTPSVFTWNMPKGMANPNAAIRLKTTQQDGQLIYEAVLPYNAFGFTADDLLTGMKFNIIINDNDGETREGYAFLSRGLGDIKDPSYYPFVVFEK